jgi:hypothetical protein
MVEHFDLDPDPAWVPNVLGYFFLGNFPTFKEKVAFYNVLGTKTIH